MGGRLRKALSLLERLAERLLAEGRSSIEGNARPAPGQGRPIRLFDATNVVKAGNTERENGGVWPIHAGFDLPDERLSAFLITDEKGAEAINPIPVVDDEIRVGDRVHSTAAPTIWPM